tara:strand:- start:858 stop:1232 length:375 start_codon:yes stop_codon:yes gene_type:complete
MSNTKIGDLIEQAHQLREVIRADERTLNSLKEDFKELSNQIIVKMDDQGAKRIGGLSANVSISETDVPTVKDWDLVYDYIKTNDSFYLLQKRMSAAAFRELLNLGHEVPGVEIFKDRKLNLRAL